MIFLDKLLKGDLFTRDMNIYIYISIFKNDIYIYNYYIYIYILTTINGMILQDMIQKHLPGPTSTGRSKRTTPATAPSLSPRSVTNSACWCCRWWPSDLPQLRVLDATQQLAERVHKWNYKPINVEVGNGSWSTDDQWEFKDPKMEIMYNIRPVFVGVFPGN